MTSEREPSFPEIHAFTIHKFTIEKAGETDVYIAECGLRYAVFSVRFLLREKEEMHMECNAVVNRYLSDNERYADLINGCQFGGQQIIAAEDLFDIDTQVNATMRANDLSKANSFPNGKATKKSNNKKAKHRDLIRKIAFGVNFMVVGLENQEAVHYLMPLRTMEYDVKEYQRQAAIIRKKARERKGITSGEFLSGFTKEDKLHPCVTLVLYYGDEWDGGCELHDLLDFTDIPEQLKPLVNNYKIHLIEIKKLQDTSVFKTDIKQVFDFIRYSEDKNKLRELVEQDAAYQHLDEDAYDMVALYTKSTELLEVKKQSMEGGGTDMCKAIREMIEDGRAEGRTEAVIDAIQRMIRKGYSKDEIYDLGYTNVEYTEAESKLHS